MQLELAFAAAAHSAISAIHSQRSRKVPASHAEHVEAPSEVWVCIPAGHVMQSSLTAVGAYFPAVHSSQELMLNT